MKLSKLKELIKSAPDNAEVTINQEGEVIITVPENIIDRIKTLEDACKWCKENECDQVVRELLMINSLFTKEGIDSPELLAYLKLRVITCALNEGWEPKSNLKGTRYIPDFGYDSITTFPNGNYIFGDASIKLCFKTQKLAKYAAKQFYDLYQDYCSVKKGDKG